MYPQNICIKWILCEEELSYHSQLIYLTKCRQVNLFPLSCRFIINYMIFFHKTFYNLIHLNMPEYLILFDDIYHLCSTHLEILSFVSNIEHWTTGIGNLNKSFFFHSHSFWNSLQFDIRNISNLKEYFWEYFCEQKIADIEENGESDLSSLDHPHYFFIIGTVIFCLLGSRLGLANALESGNV